MERNKQNQITMALQNGYLGSPSDKGRKCTGTCTHLHAHAPFACSEEPSKSRYSQRTTPVTSPKAFNRLYTRGRNLWKLPCFAAAPMKHYIHCCLLRLSASRGRSPLPQHPASPMGPALLLPSWPGEDAGITFAPGEEGTVQPSCYPAEVCLCPASA